MPNPRKSAQPRKRRTRGAQRPEESDAGPPATSYGSPELIVVAHAEAGIRVRRDEVVSLTGATHRQLTDVACRADVAMAPLFGPEDRVTMMAAAAAPTALAPVPDLSVYYHVDAAPVELTELAEQLNAIDEIAGAYVKPAGEPPLINDMTPAAEDTPLRTPDFVARQQYLDRAPGGIDARYAWTWPGGGGAGVSIIDCEWGWRFDHEDLVMTQGGVVVGAASSDTDHGTAVIGAISGDRTNIGITGICPDALMSAAAFSGRTAATVRSAVDRLRPGDLLLLEIHRPGPRDNFQGRNDQFGYIAIEWWPDDFDAIAFATSQGIIVVEAAGNGQQNLDDTIYSTPAPGFPSTWTNPFDRTKRDSGAVVVGAGAPPPGTHERSHGADRSRLDFSNFGALIDAQGWGHEVTSTGYGDLQGGNDKRFQYTDEFAGTSSASAIVTGALGSLQGGLRAAGKPLMTPAMARAWLRSTGSPQQDEPDRPVSSQRIGNRPDLRQLFDAHVAGKPHHKIEREVKPFTKESLERKEVKEHKEISEKFDDKLRDKLNEGGIDFFGHRVGGLGPGDRGAEATIDQRLAYVESVVDALSHFISADMRPDLSRAALSRESDVVAAKHNKDVKDKEYLAER